MPHIENKKTVLHVGCGRETLHPSFQTDGWQEIRLDIDETVQPDIVASLTDMHAVRNDTVNAVYSSHNLEHLYPHEVQLGLKEFLRVLRPDGFAFITVPDLQAVAELIVADKLDEPAYHSPAGPVAPLDIIYGYRPSLAQGNIFMAHRTGFTAKTLMQAVINAGFAWVKVARDSAFSLWAKAYKNQPDQKTAEAPIF